MNPIRVLAVLAVLTIATASTVSARTPSVAGSAASPVSIAVAVDLTDAPRNVFHTRLSIPVTPGPLTLYYPKWIPGEHGPTGPILQMAGLTMSAGGATIPWTRDLGDNFTFHCVVPAGASSLNVAFDFLSPGLTNGFTSGASASANLAVLSWNAVVLYPAGTATDNITCTPSLRVPDGWKFGTALVVSGTASGVTSFAPVSLTTLVDSPVITGSHFREIALSTGSALPPHFLDMVADSDEALVTKPSIEQSYKRLVAEANALFGAHHYNAYHFLVTLSDNVAHFGLEHHESSDDRSAERSLIDDDQWLGFSGLLPHEFVHSWNAKYRRPAGLATPDYQAPMHDDMLWIYEGLTEYLGDILTVRSGLQTREQWLDDNARLASWLDERSGRTWRPNQDTATMAADLYNAPGEWSNYRRGVDFYSEGVLLWLDVDVTIRQKTNGAKSIEDFCRAFHGAPSGPPMVKPYTFDDVVTALNQVCPNDWHQFLRSRLDSLDPHANLNGFTNAGWRLVYSDEPNVSMKSGEVRDEALDLISSAGIVVGTNGIVQDIRMGSPAAAAGIAPGMTIVAVNGRRFTKDVIRAALAGARQTSKPIPLIVENRDFFFTTSLDCKDGNRYPHLERDTSKPDVLETIMRPLTPAS